MTNDRKIALPSKVAFGVGQMAEEQGHHPDFHLTGWNKVELVLWTHAVDGLHDNDFVMAKKIDALWGDFARRTLG